jgi:5-hydroxyisourate hydrolase
MREPTLSTHVLDTRLGRPAAGVAVSLERVDGERLVAVARTDNDGRIRELAGALAPGAYRLSFEVGDYFRAQGESALFARVTLDIDVRADGRDYHVPLLVAPHLCVTYRGS